MIFTGERARDGDYGLNDVAALRANPFHAARDFEGHADRDVVGTTIQARRVGGPVVFSSTTGFLNWKTQDVTDLDYTPRADPDARQHGEGLPVHRRRFASPRRTTAPIQLADARRLRWQTGVFLFTQAYEQDAINTYAPFVFAPFAVSQHTPLSELDDFGLGVFGQGTVTFNDRLDLTAGARARLRGQERVAARTSSTRRSLPAPRSTRTRASRTSRRRWPSPTGFSPDKTLYATVGRGYKAGGFNSASPAGSEAYGEEQTWHFEGGVKTLWANGRMSDERRRLLHRLGRPAAERPQSGRAHAVLHLQRRRGRQQGRRVGSQRETRAGRRRVHGGRVHTRAVREREASRAP